MLRQGGTSAPRPTAGTNVNGTSGGGSPKHAQLPRASTGPGAAGGHGGDSELPTADGHWHGPRPSHGHGAAGVGVGFTQDGFSPVQASRSESTGAKTQGRGGVVSEPLFVVVDGHGGTEVDAVLMAHARRPRRQCCRWQCPCRSTCLAKVRRGRGEGAPPGAAARLGVPVSLAFKLLRGVTARVWVTPYPHGPGLRLLRSTRGTLPGGDLPRAQAVVVGSLRTVVPMQT